MKIEFEITTEPNKIQIKTSETKSEAYFFYLEGILKIFIQEQLFFDQSGIMFIELAIFIHKWLEEVKKGSLIDFIYDAMDYCEEPIFKFIHIKNEFYQVDSTWKEKEISTLVSKEEIIDGFKKYLSNLAYVLQIKYNIELECFF